MMVAIEISKPFQPKPIKTERYGVVQIIWLWFGVYLCRGGGLTSILNKFGDIVFDITKADVNKKLEKFNIRYGEQDE